MNPYEEAVKWLEGEVYKHGTFTMKRTEKYVDIDGTKTYSAFPDGNYSGFTVSSQHTSGGNFLQLITAMRRKEQTKEGKMNNLCDTCLRSYSDCMNEHENLPTVEFASENDDAIVNCDWYMRKPKEQTKKGEI